VFNIIKNMLSTYPLIAFRDCLFQGEQKGGYGWKKFQEKLKIPRSKSKSLRGISGGANEALLFSKLTDLFQNFREHFSKIRSKHPREYSSCYSLKPNLMSEFGFIP